VYPLALINYVAGLVNEKELAWDCGTGNGQTAVMLAKEFKKVHATDISATQLQHATPAANIMYALEPAEKTSLADKSVNLITISQALHWFNTAEFYKEVSRVASADAVIAAWTYNLLTISPEIDALINYFYDETLQGCWQAERKYVDDGYTSIYFPFTSLRAPSFSIKTDWNILALQGYLNTWSGVQNFVKKNGYNPLPKLIEEINTHWATGAKKQVTFPLFVRIARTDSYAP
ncbi:MAG: class I SAM-dependent methyltransferase, partial [Ferruginibacter sp.]